MARWVGLDLHKRVLEVCIVNDAGAVESRHRVTVTREQLKTFAQERLHSDDRVAVEATTNTWPVVELLRPFVAEIVVSNPMRTAAIAEAKVKTDKVDAATLAQLLRAQYLPGVWQPDAATAQLRQLTGRRSALVGDATAIKNRIHSILHQRLIPNPSCKLFSQQGKEWLQTILLELEPDDRAAIQRDLHLLDEVEAGVAELEQRIFTSGGADRRLKLLITLPGVDVLCAQTLLAALGDVSRFPDGDHAASYLGLVPSTKQSAAHIYHGPITKAGRGHARWMLVEAAQHVASHPGPLGVFFRRIASKKGRNVAVVATARKLVVLAFELLRRQEPYRYALPRPTAKKLSRLRMRSGGPRLATGCAKGTYATAKLANGEPCRTVKALPTIYADEHLPSLPPPPHGELRFQRHAKLTAFVAGLAEPQVQPIRRRADKSATPMRADKAKA
ncbi:MAG: IS110 family transposase [Chloroflexi bacterium]|nr:IS110 family transposase [Chloroflexota bacterium]